MGKVKKFLKDNKCKIALVACSTTMLVGGLYLGRSIERKSIDDTLVYIGDEGIELGKTIGDIQYTLTVLKQQI